MPWTLKWIGVIVGTFVVLVVADRIWYIHEMKTLAAALGVDYAKIERRGTFPFEHFKKIVHYGKTRDEVRRSMTNYDSVEERQYGPNFYETYYFKFGVLSRHGFRVEYDQFGRVHKVDDAPPVPPQDFTK